MCGDGSFGQLGTGDNHSKNLPFEVAYFNSRHVEKLAFGMRHSLVLLKGKENQSHSFSLKLMPFLSFFKEQHADMLLQFTLLPSKTPRLAVFYNQ